LVLVGTEMSRQAHCQGVNTNLLPSYRTGSFAKFPANPAPFVPAQARLHVAPDMSIDPSGLP
jgi:hypothetical protein